MNAAIVNDPKFKPCSITTAPLFWWELVGKQGNRSLNQFTTCASPRLLQRQGAAHKASVLLTPFLDTTQSRLLVLQHGINWEMGCGLGQHMDFVFLRLTVTQVRSGSVWGWALLCWALRGACLQSILRNILHLLQEQKLPISSTKWCLRFLKFVPELAIKVAAPLAKEVVAPAQMREIHDNAYFPGGGSLQFLKDQLSFSWDSPNLG